MFRAHTPPTGVCARTSCAQSSSVANQQVLVEGLQEQCRLKMMDELRRFITVDNHDAVHIGDLEKDWVVLHVVRSSSP